VVAVDVQAVWRALDDVKDPEIPAVSVVELGMIRNVRVEADWAHVDLAPTFAGCPALDVIREAVTARVRALGLRQVEVRLVLHPPWTTDWISEAGRAKLKAFGLAPPPQHGGLIQILLAEEAACPYCGSARTTLKNSFGPTLCRAIYYCDDCRQPFEQFKAL
jgi:ring-1,2-phenylacetyl-CoA epoxidase subunit PaaD